LISPIPHEKVDMIGASHAAPSRTIERSDGKDVQCNRFFCHDGDLQIPNLHSLDAEQEEAGAES
jgi:hypothetical protein